MTPTMPDLASGRSQSIPARRVQRVNTFHLHDPSNDAKRRGIASFEASIPYSARHATKMTSSSRSNNGANAPTKTHTVSTGVEMTDSTTRRFEERTSIEETASRDEGWEDVDIEPSQHARTSMDSRPSPNEIHSTVKTGRQDSPACTVPSRTSLKRRDQTTASSRRRAPLVVVIPPSRSSQGTCEPPSPADIAPGTGGKGLQPDTPSLGVPLPEYSPLTPTGHWLHESGPYSPRLAWQNARSSDQAEGRPPGTLQYRNGDTGPHRPRAKPKLSLKMRSSASLRQSLTGDYAEPLSATLKRLGAKRVTRLHRGDATWEEKPSEDWFKQQRSDFFARGETQGRYGGNEALQNPLQDSTKQPTVDAGPQRMASERGSSRRSLSVARARKDDQRRRTGKGDGWGGLLAPRDWFKRYSLGPLRSPVDLEAVADDGERHPPGSSQGHTARQAAAIDSQAREDVDDGDDYAASAARLEGQVGRSEPQGMAHSIGLGESGASTLQPTAWQQSCDTQGEDISSLDRPKRRVRFTSGLAELIPAESADASRLSTYKLFDRSGQSAKDAEGDQAIPMRPLSLKSRAWKDQEAEEEAAQSPSAAGSMPLPLYSPPVHSSERETTSRGREKARAMRFNDEGVDSGSWPTNPSFAERKGKGKVRSSWNSLENDGCSGSSRRHSGRYPPKAAFLDPYRSASTGGRKSLDSQGGLGDCSTVWSDSEDGASQYEYRSHTRGYHPRKCSDRDPYQSRRRLLRAGFMALLFFLVLLAISLGVTLRVLSHDLSLSEQTVFALEDELRSGDAAGAALPTSTSADSSASASPQTMPISVVTVTAPAATPAATDTNGSAVASDDGTDTSSSLTSSVSADASLPSTTTTSYHTAAVESAVAQADAGDAAMTSSDQATMTS